MSGATRWNRPIGLPEKTGSHTPRICPACGEDRTGVRFIQEICQICFRQGRPFPDQAALRASEETIPPHDPILARDSTRDGIEKEEPMPELKACRHCGKEMAKGSLYRHEKVMCEKRPDAGTAPVARARAAPGRHPRKSSSKDKARNGRAPRPAEQSAKPNGHCPDCFFRDLDSAIARDLVTDAIRGGMSLETAAGFVRRCLSTQA